jgi:hypothetical protein
LLYHNRFLDRRLIPLRSAFGANRAVYCLDCRGAELLRLRHGGPIAWRPADNDRELFFIEHFVAANDFRVIVTLACRRFGLQFEWTDERALRVAAARRQTWNHTAMSVIPDGHFFVTDAARRPYGFALELDRATVEEKRLALRALQVRLTVDGDGAKLTGAIPENLATTGQTWTCLSDMHSLAERRTLVFLREVRDPGQS